MLWVLLALAALALLAVLLRAFSKKRRPPNPGTPVLRAIKELEQGRFDFRLPLLDDPDSLGLRESLNNLAQKLQNLVGGLKSQLRHQELILSSMLEGVIVIDNNQQITSINPSACAMLENKLDNVLGRSVSEALRNSDLIKFVARVQQSDSALDAEVVLLGAESEKFLAVYGRNLSDDSGKQLGSLIVLNDITRIKQLETVRREFVANVSHELKTPITSIKGFVETLLSGALDSPEDSRRFLEIIERQVERLNSIFNDLLSLSRIEQQRDRSEITLAPQEILPILQDALENCAGKAAEKQITINTDYPKPLFALLNARLLEQAVANLIENAIEFSDNGSSIKIGAYQQNREVVVFVKDRGCGIEKSHLPRIFERFYRVDESRNRKFGGTGLGLAIVKHIAQAHGGQASVESVMGQGSTFYIRLPEPEQNSLGLSKIAV